MQHEIWITHETIYDFDRSVDGAAVRARLRPPDSATQTIQESEVHCHPRPTERKRLVGPDGSMVDRFIMREPLRRIEVRGQTRLTWTPGATGTPSGGPPADAGVDLAPAWARPGGEIWHWARRALPDGGPSRPEIAAFLDMLHSAFVFDPTATTIATPVPAFFAARRGVCQDFAALAAGCLQARGVPVRLVFGYLIRDPDGGPRFEEGQPHAWLSAWIPGSGWWDADPTTGLTPPANHVTLRRGLRLRDIQPVNGRLLARNVGQRLSVRVTVVKAAAPS